MQPLSALLLTLACLVLPIEGLFARSGTLPNGLRYVIEACAYDDTKVSAQLYVAVGTLDERPDERGYAHLIEHLAFCRDGAYLDEAFPVVLNADAMHRGFMANAYTSIDHTVYQIDLDRKQGGHLSEALDFFHHLLGPLDLNQEWVDHEAAVILEEHNLREGYLQTRVNGCLEQLFANQLFVQDELRQIFECTQSASVASLTRFHEKFYGPSRAVLVITGKIDEADTEAQLAKAFSGLENPRQLAKRITPSSLPQMAPISLVKESGLNSPRIALFSAVGHSEGSRRGQNLQLEVEVEIARRILWRRVVHWAAVKGLDLGFSHDVFLGGNTLSVIDVGCAEDNYEQVMHDLIGFTLDMQESSVSQSELGLIRQQCENEWREALDDSEITAEQRAENYINCLVRYGAISEPQELIRDRIRCLGSVTPKSIKRALSARDVRRQLGTILRWPSLFSEPDQGHLEQLVKQALRQKNPAESRLAVEQQLSRRNRELDNHSNWSLSEWNWPEGVSQAQLHKASPMRGLTYVHKRDSSADRVIQLWLDISDWEGDLVTKFALSLLAKEVQRWNAVIADDWVICDLQYDDKTCLLEIQYDDRDARMARALVRRLLVDTFVDQERFARLQDQFLVENLRMRKLDVVEAVELAFAEYVQQRELCPPVNEIMGLTQRKVQQRIDWIRRSAPLELVVVDGTSHFWAFRHMEEIFGDLGDRSVAGVKQFKPAPFSAPLEVFTEAPGNRAALIFGFQLSEAAESQLTVISHLLRSRFLTAMRYQDPLVYSVHTVARRDSHDSSYLGFQFVCSGDHVELVKQKFAAELRAVASSGISFEELVGCGMYADVPVWELIESVTTIDEALQHLASTESICLTAYAQDSENALAK